MSSKTKSRDEVLRELVNQEIQKSLGSIEERSEGADVMKEFFQQAMSGELSARNARKEPGHNGARFVRALAACRGNPANAAKWAQKHFGDDAVSKALSSADLTGGGVLVPEQMSQEIIEFLRPRAVVRRMGPNIMPMNSGVVTIPKQTGGATSEYIGESTSQNASQPTTGQLRLVWRKLRTTVPLSNELLQFSNPSADTMVRDDMVASMAVREDKAFIRDDGVDAKPKGLFHWCPTTNKFDASGTTLTNVENDLLKAISTLENNDVRMIRPGWMMSPRSKNGFIQLRDGNGNLAFPEMRDPQNPTLLGFPVGLSNNIPNNLDSGSDESEIYLVDFADAIIGESNQIMIEVSNEASYTDSGGNLVSAFDQDETVIKAIMRHDFVMRHEESIAIIESVTLGS